MEHKMSYCKSSKANCILLRDILTKHTQSYENYFKFYDMNKSRIEILVITKLEIVLLYKTNHTNLLKG